MMQPSSKERASHARITNSMSAYFGKIGKIDWSYQGCTNAVVLSFLDTPHVCYCFWDNELLYLVEILHRYEIHSLGEESNPRLADKLLLLGLNSTSLETAEENARYYAADNNNTFVGIFDTVAGKYVKLFRYALEVIESPIVN